MTVETSFAVAMPLLCVVLLFCFLAVWWRRRQRVQRQDPQHSLPAPEAGPVEAELIAMRAAIEALPVRQQACESDVAGECAVCLASFVEGEEIKRLPCSHQFHSTCIDEWLLRSFSRTSMPPPCPLCKAPVAAPEPAASEGKRVETVLRNPADGQGVQIHISQAAHTARV